MYLPKKLFCKKGEIDVYLLWTMLIAAAILVLAFSVYRLPEIL